MFKKVLLLAGLFFCLPLSVWGADLAVSKSQISISPEVPLAGEPIRVYATVHNLDSTDTRGTVYFYANDIQIGSEQPITVLADDSATVFVDWGPREGYYTVRVDVIDIETGDPNNGNNSVTLTDVIIDLDTDHDGIPNSNDLDDDGDGVNDGVEIIRGTNPLLSDTDGDDAHDGLDMFPNDPTEKHDADGDGIGDNADPDDDNDGVPDDQDIAPFDPSISEAQKPVVEEKKEEPKVSQPVVETQPAPTQTIPSTKEETPLVSDTQENASDVVEEEVIETDIEEVSYTFPDESEADYTLPVIIARSKVSWNTYSFEALGVDPSYLLLWDFGDGALSQERSVTHTFSGSGEYMVTLSVSDSLGGIGTEDVAISIGFWDIGNIWVKILIALLGLFSLSLAGYIIFETVTKQKD